MSEGVAHIKARRPKPTGAPPQAEPPLGLPKTLIAFVILLGLAAGVTILLSSTHDWILKTILTGVIAP